MQEYKLNIQMDEPMELSVVEGTTFLELAKQFQQEYYEEDIILAKINGKLVELNKKIHESGELSFITVGERDGRRTYRRSVTLVMQHAVEKIYGEEVSVQILYSLGEGDYCELCRHSGENSKREILGSDELRLEEIKACMMDIVQQNLPIVKHSEKTQKAEALFREKGMHDKASLLYYRRSSRVNLYNLDGTDDYFYGYMAPETGILGYFDLVAYETGFVLLFPKKQTKKVEALVTSNKLFHTFRESRAWSRMLGIGTIGALNDAIANGRGQELILLQEGLMEERIGNLAAEIAKDKDKKFIMIAGPSSSGKTSFANRLSIQLIAKGLKPHAVSLDNYYADRERCPRNPDGSFDFECLEALDVEQFNTDMTKLLAGETVNMPAFNFKTGKREYSNRFLTLGEDDILVIEGIHGLNDKLSYTLPSESKFKIYISALTQLNIDEHNPLSTTDGRLLRRIVRDARTRGTTAQDTIKMWPSVRRGEELYIFPFQESADVMFNSALVYELAVLKVYAEPLLFQIPRDSEEYYEAKRLLKFLDYFLPMPVEGISKNSLMREFVGGSCFNV